MKLLVLPLILVAIFPVVSFSAGNAKHHFQPQKTIVQSNKKHLHLHASKQRFHECVHDQLDHKPVKATNIPYKNHPYDKSIPKNERRKLALLDETYDYIRITPYYDEIESSLSGSNLTFVKSLVSSSIRYFESFTKVVPIDDTFYLPRRCISWYTVNGYINCISYSDTCGRGM